MLLDAWREFKLALAFLTRLPLRSEQWSDGDLAASVVMFAPVGALVGGIAALVYTVVAWSGLPPWIAAVAAITAMVWITGGLHEDGLADVADGFGAGQTRADRLRIMRDPQIGSHGTVALVLGLSARIGALAALGDPVPVGLVLIAAGAVSRSAIAVVMLALPRARADGLAASAGRPHWMRVTAVALVAIALAMLLLGPHPGSAGLLGAALGASAVAWLAERRIGGQTGDVLGAVQQLAETGFLLGALAVFGTS